MLLHVDDTGFEKKPTSTEIAAIKRHFTDLSSIKDLTIQQIVSALIAGQTVQPGVTPFSEKSRAEGRKGTVKEDFTRQSLFMVDVDNDLAGFERETPESVARMLAAHNLKVSFAYKTFNCTPENLRFRYGVVCEEDITDKVERDRIQAALIALNKQSDSKCTNADRIFFGTDKGLIDGYTNYEAVCRKADLLALADAMQIPDDPEQAVKTATAAPKADRAKFGSTIPTGQRHGTLVSFASTVLTKYGVCDKAYNAYLERVAQCEEPLQEAEVQKIWVDACMFFESRIAKNSNYAKPNEYVAKILREKLEPTDYSDVGQANVFVAVFADKVAYTPATNFIVYNGKFWEESETKAQALSQLLTERQLEEARRRVRKAQSELNQAVENEEDERIKTAKKILQADEHFRDYVIKRRKSDSVKATLTEVRPKVEINVAQLDADGYLLNTPKGTVDLRTGSMKPHCPTDFCTKITSVAPDTINAEVFAEFMARVTMGDKDLERYLQEVAGMCAIGKVFRENLIIAYGAGGNGKSTLFNLLAHVLGDYSGAMSSEILTANCRKNKSPELADLRGKRLVIAAELEEGMRLDTGTLKRLCSVDPIKAEKKYKDPIEFDPAHTVVLYTNHLPKIGSIDKGTWDRIVVVPFMANFRGMKGEIMNYANDLFDRCGGAVLSWIIEGARRFIANEYNIDLPECVKRAIDQYRENNDWLEIFLAECCEMDRSFTQKSGELYTRYKYYCDSTGDYRRSLADFKAALTMAGYETRKTKTGAIVYGLRVKSVYAEYDEPTPWDDLSLSGEDACR